MLREARHLHDVSAARALRLLPVVRLTGTAYINMYSYFAAASLVAIAQSALLVPVLAATEDLYETPSCVPDQDVPGEWSCAEAGWTPGSIERDLGVSQRLDGSEEERDRIRYVIDDMEDYYDREVPLMPDSLKGRW